MTRYVVKGKVKNHIHSMSRIVLGGYIACEWCDYKQREKPALAVESNETSKAAARAIEGSPRAAARMAVLRALRENPQGLSDQKIQEITGLAESTERPRRVELVEQNLVKDSGRKTITKSGREAVLWVAVRLR